MKFVNKILDIFLIYNRDPALLINVKLSLVEREENETKVFNEEIFESIPLQVYKEKFMDLQLVT